MLAIPYDDIVNAFTVDLEDWTQSVLSATAPITDCVLANTDRVLGLLASSGVRATFFALGKVCERFPQLLPRIAAAGHEIACHGYGHELLHHLTPERFRADVLQSTDIIESQTGGRPIGYRAPAFSITKRTLWAGPILAELGFQYSSSIFPFAGRRYGIADAPRFPYQWPTCNLIEFPLTTIQIAGRNLPAAGGGYLRLLPAPLIAAAIRRVNREGHPAALYVHPYELAPAEIHGLRRDGWRISLRTRVTQTAFRRRVADRLAFLIDRFRFAPMAEVLQLHGLLPCGHLPAVIAQKSMAASIALRGRSEPKARLQTPSIAESAAGQRPPTSRT